MDSKFHAFMFPWFAFGHMIPFLHLANNLAEKGHRVTFLMPKKAQKQLEHLNRFPDNIVFHPLTISRVDGLPDGAETASDIHFSLTSSLASAMDLTRDQVEAAVRVKKPDLIFFDFAEWVTDIAKTYGAKSVYFISFSAASACTSMVPGLRPDNLDVPPPGYPSSKVLLRGQETNEFSFIFNPFGEGDTLYKRNTKGLTNCDVISIRTCQEVEGKFCVFLKSQFQRKVLLTGPILPEPDKTMPLEDRWNLWLNRFEQGSVVFCALGSQIILEKDQFQELCLGMELTGLPFLVAVQPPRGSSTVQEGLPEGFEERIKERGVVWGGWVQQPLILAHPSVGCFVSHCGFGSMWESLMSDCQIVFLPYFADQILNTRLMTEELEVSVEVERGEARWFSKENLSVAVRSVMDKDSELGNRVRRNHAEWKEVLFRHGLMNDYVNKFVEALEKLVQNINLE
ncbi:UDP-glycosyltransferase 79B6 [Cardamine amara subsp. amara]|uniref:Glycosyltransferase n=1 Tax=Cardamine amara subsp. amara TaxID=228776 RepID=A0ABD1AKD5_CARAN